MDIEWSEHLIQALTEAGGTRVRDAKKQGEKVVMSDGLTISPAYSRREGKEGSCNEGISVKSKGSQERNTTRALQGKTARRKE